MAIGINVTEIPDSEDEPMTSSPVAVSDAAVVNLCKAALAPAQELQDSTVPQQASAEHVAKPVSRRTDGLCADQGNACVDVETTRIDQTDLQPHPTPQQEGATENVSNNDAICQNEVDVTIPDHHLAAVEANSRRAGSTPAPELHLQPHIIPAPDAERQDVGGTMQSKAPVAEETLEFRTYNGEVNEPMFLRTEQEPLQTAALCIDDTVVEVAQPKPIPNYVPENDSMSGQAEKIMDHVDHFSKFDHLPDTPSISAEEKDEGSLVLQDLAEPSINSSKVPEIESVSTDNDQAQAHGKDGVETRDRKSNSDAPVSSLLSPCRPIPTETTEGAAKGSDSQVNSRMIGSALDLPATGIEHSSLQTVNGTALSTPEQQYDGHMLQDSSKQSSLATLAAELYLSAVMEHEADAKQSKKFGTELSDLHTYPDSTIDGTVQEHPFEIANDSNETKGGTKVSDTKMDVNEHEIVAGTETQLDKVENVSHSIACDAIPYPLSAKRPLEDEKKVTQADEQPAGNKPTTRNETPTTTQSSMETNIPSASTESKQQTQLDQSQKHTEALPSSTPKRTPQETTLAELKAQKAALLSSLANFPAIQVLMEENDASDVDMSDGDGEPTDADVMAAANKIVKEHIKLLHEYNELKDVGQGLMGLIADQRGVRIVEIQDEFGVDAQD
ncbi:Swi5-domain-containing protein [Dothidotthia symphoricarpi CBS 119687]|uniref:Swi5-domain-containing protein n=1 Tax=Dothidotthia symphoricarpi CBS 119687 TaxID=1392245 RepID=A0A6A6AB62_9PLEO|nr:Swi5-domain-containing protein [Dothidotthia symphoricarpi CBS 119687]KAF2128453.1 Swi5-domain-containing protein [Dothidotthia symphoricarpi CBS 119687]